MNEHAQANANTCAHTCKTHARAQIKKHGRKYAKYTRAHEKQVKHTRNTCKTRAHTRQTRACTCKTHAKHMQNTPVHRQNMRAHMQCTDEGEGGGRGGVDLNAMSSLSEPAWKVTIHQRLHHQRKIAPQYRDIIPFLAVQKPN